MFYNCTPKLCCCHMDPKCQSFLSPKNRRTSSKKIIYPAEEVIWQAPGSTSVAGQVWTPTNCWGSVHRRSNHDNPHSACCSSTCVTAVFDKLSSSYYRYYHLAIRLNGLLVAGYIAASTSMPEEHPFCSTDHLDIALTSKQEKQVCQG